MESSVLNYSPSFITSLILKNKDLCSVKLNEVYPSIDESKFSRTRKSLERLGLVSNVTKQAKAIERFFTNPDNVDDILSDDNIRDIIKNNITLKPKELNALYPKVSTHKFNALRYWLLVDDYRQTRLYKEVEKYRKAYYKSVEKYKDKGFEGKNLIRNFVAEVVANSGVYGVIGCLPHFDWLGEVAIDKLSIGNSYVGIANNINVFKGASINIELLGLNATMEYGSMHEVISKYPSNSFAHINMDFCGVMPKQAETVVYAIQNDLVQVGGYLFLTFKRVVRNVKIGFYAERFNHYKTLNTSESGLTNSDFANDNLLKDIIGDKFKLVKKISYQTGSPMVFYAIKRIK